MNNFLLFAALVAYLPVASHYLPAQVTLPQPEPSTAKEYTDEAAVVERVQRGAVEVVMVVFQGGAAVVVAGVHLALQVQAATAATA